MGDFETLNSKSGVSKSNSWKITSFLKTMSLQREPFLTMFHTINLSLLVVTKCGLMLIIILSNYQQCPLPLAPKLLWNHPFVSRWLTGQSLSWHKKTLKRNVLLSTRKVPTAHVSISIRLYLRRRWSLTPMRTRPSYSESVNSSWLQEQSR